MTDELDVFFIENLDELLFFLFVDFILLLEESLLLCDHLSGGSRLGLQEAL